VVQEGKRHPALNVLAESTRLSTAVVYSNLVYSGDFPAAYQVNEYSDSLTGEFAVLLKVGAVYWFVFRGSDDSKDWVINASAFPLYVSGAFVHGGFGITHIRMWKRIRADIEALPDGSEICITGHSKGGAGAELLAWRLRKMGDRVSLFTFGKPNVFLKVSHGRMSLHRQISVVSGSDFVTRIPAIAYHPSRTQNKLYFNNWNGEGVINPSRDHVLNDMETDEVFSDHSIDLYENLVVNFGGTEQCIKLFS